ncbi:hypothetical protein LOAG_02206 [Loa loa]|uniref:Uncharacterized protein n=1 Tax=Loa loa TaxID=7209 RepID=A0A1S0U743_LOALO|nr:hypothetical protein LOAG_02206 [Loa loa]EFO26286.1 hypothetical protein LOAG_02206 [Loa loa]
MMQKRSEKMQAILHDIARWDRSNAAGVFQRNGGCSVLPTTGYPLTFHPDRPTPSPASVIETERSIQNSEMKDSAYRMGGVRASDESTPRRDSAGKREIGLEQCLIPRMA